MAKKQDVVELLQGLPPDALEEVKNFADFLKRKRAQQTSQSAKTLAKRQADAIRRWAGKDLGPGFSGKDHDAVLYGRER